MVEKEKRVYELIKFRSFMNIPVSEIDVKRIWGKSLLKSLGSNLKLKSYSSDIVEKKIVFAKENVKYLKVFNLVKFIGISGSVASGFAKEGDDIDLIIVVANNCAWLYRGIISLLNIFQNKVRAKRHKDIKNKFCLNIIAEERDLSFNNDIFNFHELMYVIPIYNEKYINHIYLSNPWLRDNYFIKRELLVYPDLIKKRGGFLLSFFNNIFYILQIFFMFISGHRPDIRRIISNYKRGRIEFFDNDFKKEKISKYLKGI
jgi:predicted nucleotidyltransferase